MLLPGGFGGGIHQSLDQSEDRVESRHDDRSHPLSRPWSAVTSCTKTGGSHAFRQRPGGGQHQLTPTWQLWTKLVTSDWDTHGPDQRFSVDDSHRLSGRVTLFPAQQLSDVTGRFCGHMPPSTGFVVYWSCLVLCVSPTRGSQAVSCPTGPTNQCLSMFTLW